MSQHVDTYDDADLRRDVRFLKRYAAGSTAVIMVLTIAGFSAASRHERFDVIDVERINIVEKNGTLRLVISNRERAPDAVIAGKPYKRSGSNSAGMIFYNDEGNENGGLGWSGETRDGRYQAEAGLLFDQYNQDQTIGLTYSDNNGRRSAGLRLWDRPDRPVTELADMVEPIKHMPDGPEKTRRMAAVRDSATRLGLGGAQRLFVGKLPDKSAAIVLGRQGASAAAARGGFERRGADRGARRGGARHASSAGGGALKGLCQEVVRKDCDDLACLR